MVKNERFINMLLITNVMAIKRTLGTIVLASTIALLAGCAPPGGPGNYVEGKVVSEYGNLARIVESSSGALIGNESVKLGNPVYGLKVETPQGIYIIEVDVNDQSGSRGPHSAYNLAAAIEEGTKVKFPLRYDERDLFSVDRLGILDPDDIEIRE